ncbi:hypothetical protein CDV31_011912 [Fusarium ambrosium]|uniref:C2H2-type domain-containing protein n=1 Tax=Fusarium ambrosium TaxID=131363 RepID=A0A428TDT8_9HYPO|nr:hypothetical protein CDV31_011912 [Fusarium ambrosium]
MKRSQLTQEYFSKRNKPPPPADQHRAFNLVVRITLMVKCSADNQPSGLLELGSQPIQGNIPRQVALEVLDSLQNVLFPFHSTSEQILHDLASEEGFDPDCLRYDAAMYRAESEGDLSYSYFGNCLVDLFEELEDPSPRGHNEGGGMEAYLTDHLNNAALSEEYTQVELAKEFDNMHDATQNYFPSLSLDAADPQDGSLLSWQPEDLVHSTTAAATSVARRSRVSKRTRPKGKTAEKRRFPCTFCCDSFKSKFDWSRHERSLHLNIEGWRCAPFGSVEISAMTGGGSCAYCGLADPTPTHLEDHDITLCKKDQIYARKYHLVQHLRCIHHVQDTPSIDSWKVEGPPVSSRCGFCDLRMETWQERTDHLVSHFRRGKTMDDWKGEHDFEPMITALVTNAIPPYLIASDSKTYAPFSAMAPNLAHADHLQQITKSAEQSFEAWSGSDPKSGAPTISLHDKSFPELLAFHLGRFAQHQTRLGVVLTDKMFQDEARRLQFGSVDPLDDTVADNEEWLSLFRSQHLEDHGRQSG